MSPPFWLGLQLGYELDLAEDKMELPFFNLADCSLLPHDVLNSPARIGSLLILFPVAAKTAFPTAGAIGGTPGSPTPPSGSWLGVMKTSTAGISCIRRIG